MTFRGLEWAFNANGPTITPTMKLILIKMGDEECTGEGHAFVSLPDLARFCGQSIEATLADLDALIEAGVIAPFDHDLGDHLLGFQLNWGQP